MRSVSLYRYFIKRALGNYLIGITFTCFYLATYWLLNPDISNGSHPLVLLLLGLPVITLFYAVCNISQYLGLWKLGLSMSLTRKNAFILYQLSFFVQALCLVLTCIIVLACTSIGRPILMDCAMLLLFGVFTMNGLTNLFGAISHFLGRVAYLITIFLCTGLGGCCGMFLNFSVDELHNSVIFTTVTHISGLHLAYSIIFYCLLSAFAYLLLRKSHV